MPEPQSPSAPSLAELREEIDRIDDAIHDALMHRVRLVDQIRAAKPAGSPTTRPAREAQILRRLMERHQGEFPRRTIVQIWQEIIDAFTHLQGSLRVAAPQSTERLARDQYGVMAEFIWEADTDALLAHAAAGEVLAVLPWPTDDEDWWVKLAAMPDRPLVFFGLPFFSSDNGLRAVAVGRTPLEPSGQDRSWLMLPSTHSIPSDARVIARNGDKMLLEIDRFIAANDPDIAAMTLLGAFPTPYLLDGNE